MTELLSITPVIMTKAQAQKILDSMKDTDYIFVGLIDYDKNRTVSGLKPVKKKKGKRFVDRAQTVVFIGDQKKVFSHMDLHNTALQDIKNIQCRGVIKTIMLPGI
ncbi:hypothetical protein [Enterocloster clostridioformis]|uniref:Uncharacterized protein n=1 Tax=Enterocloster clostridioformis TaxID=1531 RepID=A0AAP9S5C7_9FIRM|nr:hypothetical protein [Enterocloster clostridioformis]EHG33224.1 hypothetical protein HMPREF9467_00835 [ [[Clostridium] clostridioforme 2_1_49FAA]QIX89150.1 hypothetical protein FOC47_00255 [Enterocloster clostridioformis]